MGVANRLTQLLRDQCGMVGKPVPGDYWWEDRIMIPRDIVAYVPGDPDWEPLPLGTVIDLLSASLERIDLQLLAMIQDARKQLAAVSRVPENRVFMTEFSASGQFTRGFTTLPTVLDPSPALLLSAKPSTIRWASKACSRSIPGSGIGSVMRPGWMSSSFF
jgi:hypothetical protein